VKYNTSLVATGVQCECKMQRCAVIISRRGRACLRARMHVSPSNDVMNVETRNARGRRAEDFTLYLYKRWRDAWASQRLAGLPSLFAVIRALILVHMLQFTKLRKGHFY
jgi:hypothetical protein